VRAVRRGARAALWRGARAVLLARPSLVAAVVPLSVVPLSVVPLSVVPLSVVPLSVVLLSVVLLAVAPSAGAAQTPHATNYAVTPRPVVLTPQLGTFTLSDNTAVVADPLFLAVAKRFARDVAGATGFDVTVTPSTVVMDSSVATRDRLAGPRSTSLARIRLLRADGTDSAALGLEGYRLDVTPTGVTVRAANPAGAFYALETFKQLLPAAIFRDAPLPGTRWTASAVHIEDAPRFAWRGAHLDVVRHFMPKEFVKKYIDLLARHKLNRFHWHLTDDQGWRLEITKYPRLTSVGSCREQTAVGTHNPDPTKRVFDGKQHCGFYTQDDVREIVAYAAERQITVVPEIEMPGHAQAAIAAYPELGVRRDTTVGVMQVWGVGDFILSPDDRTVSFMQDVLSEVITLFPGPYIHIGGDEAVKTQWIASPIVQARMQQLGVKDVHALQSWFIRQMDTFLTKNGRRMVGWDEILEGGLAEHATVMSWRGMRGGIAAAKSKHDVIMTPGSHTYFDHYQSRDRQNEPLAIGGFTPLDSAYAFEPVPPSLTAAEARYILGAQAQLWTEYMLDARHVEYMAFPRLTALAEALWSAKSRRNFEDFLQRLGPHLQRLDAMDVNYRKLDSMLVRRVN